MSKKFQFLILSVQDYCLPHIFFPDLNAQPFSIQPKLGLTAPFFRKLKMLGFRRELERWFRRFFLGFKTELVELFLYLKNPQSYKKNFCTNGFLRIFQSQARLVFVSTMFFRFFTVFRGLRLNAQSCLHEKIPCATSFHPLSIDTKNMFLKIF